MKRHLIALAGAVGVLLTAGAGVAGADTQAVGQTAGTAQSATSNATSTQTHPSNSNISVRIFSPGNGGSVSQDNTSAAAAAAGNAALTAQGAAQQQSGSGGSGTQAVGQDAGTLQSANADATSTQDHPSNDNISVRIGSPGDDGDVSQSNTSAALALAGNAAATKQIADQQQGGGSCCKSGGGSGVQAVGQQAGTKQDANADATSTQDHPSNTNTPVRIGSPGDNGSVSQSNDSAAEAAAGNLAFTGQAAHQRQSGSCGCAKDLVQAVGQKAFTDQSADAEATSTQKGASNTNAPVRIGSYGDDGDVSQSNDSLAFAGAGNLAKTFQLADQSQSGRGSCGCDGYGSSDPGVQAVGQWAFTGQHANADADSEQYYPKNANYPVRIKSPGGGGSVDQSNTSLAKSLAFNAALTFQGALQRQ